MKKIEISLQRKIAAVAICIADFLRIFSSLVIAVPVGAVACKALIESWTGEKIE